MIKKLENRDFTEYKLDHLVQHADRYVGDALSSTPPWDDRFDRLLNFIIDDV